MGVTVEIADPELLPELVGQLTANGCMTRAVEASICWVVHLKAVDAAEEWYELHFFLRAWQARHGVAVNLRPAWNRNGNGSNGSD